jgi:hypothetical protein
MALGPVRSGTLGQFNVGLAAGVGFLLPLGAQIDALIAVGLGPFQVDLSARLSAAISASASLGIQFGNPYAGIQAVLSALANIQAALSAALMFPMPSVQFGAQLSAMAALQGTLAVQLGALQLAIALALQIKIPALRAAAELTASLNAGPAFAFTFDGPLAAEGANIGALFASGLVDGSNSILPTDQVYGVVLLSSVPSVQAALGAIIQVA